MLLYLVMVSQMSLSSKGKGGLLGNPRKYPIEFRCFVFIAQQSNTGPCAGASM